MSVMQSRTQHGGFRGNSRQLYSRNPGPSNTYNNYYHDNQGNGVNHCNNYYNNPHPLYKVNREYTQNTNGYIHPEIAPPTKKRKFTSSSWEDNGRQYNYDNTLQKYPLPNNSVPYHYMPQIGYNTSENNLSTSNINLVAPAMGNIRVDTSSRPSKRVRSIFEEDDDVVVFMSRDEIEKCSPSRKDGIDAMHEMHLRYSYCAFIQNVGLQLELPQTTVGTAMVLCHRFFLRRSHASHDRFLIATAALFLAAKSEETGRPLNNVLRVSCEVFHKQDFTLFSYSLPLDWFEQYRERVIEAEQLILTTLNFELGVQHPYDPLISTLEKLGFAQTVLVNLALNLVSEGLRSSLWLQFKPQQIAAGAAYLAAKFLNFDLASYHSVWQEFQTPQPILRDVARQLMELF